jgi:UTP-glucose-1-phosphate uridylyltransferase/mevalonate kinase
MKIFTPGRICLFGEHSDWAGGYRRINGELEKGYTIITGTNQGLYAEVTPNPNRLIFRSSPDEEGNRQELDVPMDRDALLAEAETGGYFSYVAGVAYQILTNSQIRGLQIDNYRSDLPRKKGLSSSAAVCVLVARAFNRVYDLKMTVRGEMEYAYLGEITTPSRCGRMDQGCAYGNRPVLMAYDGDRMDVKELSTPNDLHFVIVDLHAGKDTKEILHKLNHCYPFADDEEQRNVQDFLGPISARLTHEAADAIHEGDAERIGALMVEAQAEFDKHLVPACPSQLTAPVLHKALTHDSIQEHIFGGKGVGSQGDGTAQFIVKDLEAQDRVIEIIERDLDMSCLRLTIRAGRRVRRAVIPAAGFGTRMFPASKAIKKELFPVVGREGICKPVIMAIVEEALSGGIEEVAIVVQTEDRDLFESFFSQPPPIEHYNKLSKANQERSRELMDIGSRITWLCQDTQEGFGHAVACAADWVGDEPFLLLLGDHLYASSTDRSCARQLLDAYERYGKSVVGLKVTPGDQIHNFGCASGVWDEPGSLMSVTEFYEKPDLDYARSHLQVEGAETDTFFSVFGQYVLDSRIFEYLRENIRDDAREKGEFQLTSCLDRLRQEDGFAGYVVQGRRFDIGLPDAYRQALIDFRDA